MKQSKRILLVDDDQSVVDLLRATFEKNGYRIDYCFNLDELARRINSHSYDAILVDLVLGEEEGLAALPLIFAQAPYSIIFILTAHGTIETAVDAMRRGVAGFLTKDSGPEKIFEEVSRVLEQSQDISESAVQEPDEMEKTLGIVGESQAIIDLRKTLYRLKDVDSTVLVLGESGTGKELVARGLHMASARRGERFEAINCGAIPETLLESELFGHKRGAFTDAKMDRKGIFEICSEGTLFLDEIGEMPVTLQTKLLRVLQEKEVTPIGSSTPIKIRTRVVAATNRNLIEEVRAGRFREDLYFRLSVLPLVIPPLRERRHDVPLLVNFFLARFNARFNKTIAYPGPDVLNRLVAYDWPGNVRELQNAVERGVILSTDNKLHFADMFFNIDLTVVGAASSSDASAQSPVTGEILALPLSEAKQAFEKAYLEHVLSVSKGNISQAAQLSGRYRADIYRLMNKYQVKAD